MKTDLTKLSVLKNNNRRCDCWICKRGRKFYRITAKLPPKERNWMRGFYDAVLDSETELEMKQAQGKWIAN